MKQQIEELIKEAEESIGHNEERCERARKRKLYRARQFYLGMIEMEKIWLSRPLGRNHTANRLTY